MDIKNPFKQGEIEASLDQEITALLAKLAKEDDKTTEKYASMVDQLTKLNDIRKTGRISKDTLATIGANLTGILILLSHERAHVITSKAFSLIRKVF